MSFIIRVAEEPSPARDLDVAASVCGPSGEPQVRISVASPEFSLHILAFPETGASSIWWEHPQATADSSFILIYGWCYPIDSAATVLNEHDFTEILARVRGGDVPFNDNIGGNYVGVVYDAVNRQVTVQPDQWAMSAVHFGEAGGAVTISDRAAIIAAIHRTAIDGYSLLSLLRGTHMPFGRSLFAGVRRLMPSQYLRAGVTQPRLWVGRTRDLFGRVADVTFTEAIEKVKASLSRLGRRIAIVPRTMIDLTGGHDTRFLAAAVSAAGSGDDIVWRVGGAAEHPDVRIARRITAMHGWRLLRLDRGYPGDASEAELQRAAVASDGSCTLDVAFGRLLVEQSPAADCDWLVGCLGGELLRGWFWRHELLGLGRRGDVDYASLLTYRLYASRAVDVALLGQGAPTLMLHDDVLLAPYRQLGAAGGELAKAYKLDLMALHKWCYSGGNFQSWFRGVRNIKLAFLTWEVTREWLSIPWRFRRNRRLMLEVMCQLDGGLGSIPNDAGQPMHVLSFRTAPEYIASWTRDLAGIVPRVVRRYVGHFGARRGGVPIGSIPRSWTALLETPGFVDGFVDKERLERMRRLALASTATADQLRSLYCLLSLELLGRAIPALERRLEFREAAAS